MARTVRIYHNPKCGTSREALRLIREAGVEPEVIEYLKEPFTRELLEALLKKLKKKPSELLRRKEKLVAELGLDQPAVEEKDLLAAMLDHPILVDRPIVVAGARALLCRPAIRVMEIL